MGNDFVHRYGVIGHMTLSVPADFNFWKTVYSHGWCSLLPFRVDKVHHRLHRTLLLKDKRAVECSISDGSSQIEVDVFANGRLMPSHRQEIRHQLRSCLRPEEDLSGFYRATRLYGDFRWISRSRAGRLLRAPTVFEDIVKMMCTTNCSWTLTTIMVENLCSELGTRFDKNSYAFPSPGAVAGVSETFMRRRIRAGYRAPYILKFAEQVASGILDVESWRSSSLSTSDLFELLQQVKGIGEYSAGNILKLLGRYDYLGLDSWIRAKYYDTYHKGRKVSDKTIERRYGQYGKWRGLFIWLDMTRDWYDHKFPF